MRPLKKLIVYLIVQAAIVAASQQAKSQPPVPAKKAAAENTVTPPKKAGPVEIPDDGPIPLITGPTAARVGDLVVLDATGSQADFFDWMIDTSGVVLPDDGAAEAARRKARELRSMGFKVVEPKAADGARTHIILDGGKKLILASYQGTWRVSLAVSNAKGVRQMPWRIVVVGNNGGPQPPPPNGGPKPPPQPPELKTDFSLEAKQWLATVPAATRGIITHKGKTVQWNLAETLNDIGRLWKTAGSIGAMEVLLHNGIKAVFTPLGAKAKDWTSFANSANVVLDELKAKGATPEQYGTALMSIARGIQ